MRPAKFAWITSAAIVALGLAPVARAQSLPPSSPGTLLVSLGDSITTGYDLGPNNQKPSQLAYPYLIGKAEHMQVRDLAVSGMTSTKLLAALGTQKYAKAIRDASVISVDIGSDDLLGPALRDGLLNPANPNPPITPQQLAQFAGSLIAYQHALPQILSQIRTLNPTAPILLYNIYNPIPRRYPELYTLSNILVGIMNVIVHESAAFSSNTVPVNDYSAFSGHINAFILPENVHPTVRGQQVLAKLGEHALSKLATGDQPSG